MSSSQIGDPNDHFVCEIKIAKMFPSMVDGVRSVSIHVKFWGRRFVRSSSASEATEPLAPSSSRSEEVGDHYCSRVYLCLLLCYYIQLLRLHERDGGRLLSRGCAAKAEAAFLIWCRHPQSLPCATLSHNNISFFGWKGLVKSSKHKLGLTWLN